MIVTVCTVAETGLDASRGRRGVGDDKLGAERIFYGTQDGPCSGWSHINQACIQLVMYYREYYIRLTWSCINQEVEIGTRTMSTATLYTVEGRARTRYIRAGWYTMDLERRVSAAPGE